MAPSISPPPMKRRRLNSASATTAATAPSEGKTLRVFAWNINGITPFIPTPQPKISSFFSASSKNPTRHSAINSSHDPAEYSLRDFLRRHSWPHLLLLQEVKIAPSDHATQTAVRRAIAAPCPADDEPHYEAHFVLPTDPHNARGFGRKVHGVCSIMRTDFAASSGLRVRTVEWDAEGRLSVLETDGMTGGWPKLAIWNVYAVNGTEYDYRSSETGAVVGTRHDRKLEVHRLLSEEVARLESQGYGVVLAGDMNVARDVRDGFPRLRTKPYQHVVNRKDFVRRFFDGEEGGLAMVDTFRDMHGDARRYTWFSRAVEFGESCDRVDYVICSRSLHGTLAEAGMLDSRAERGPSDHVPVFATFAFDGHANGIEGETVDREAVS